MRKFLAVLSAGKIITCLELADLAKAWAIKLAERGRILYPELSDIGENIHLITSHEEICLSENQMPPTAGSGETCTGVSQSIFKIIWQKID